MRTPGPAAPADDQRPEPGPYISHTLRRSGHRATRILAVLCLVLAPLTVGLVIRSTGLPTHEPKPLEQATADAWKTTGALSQSLRQLRPGRSRSPARALVSGAADAVGASAKRVEALELPTADTPLRVRVLRALRADAEWIDAVASTLANPRSQRRASLATLAKTAAVATAVVANDIDAAADTVGGTGRLLSATRRA